MMKEKKLDLGAFKVSIIVSLLLVIFKVAAGLITHSVAIFASALDSLLDVGSSTANFIAAREASKPPDREHEYGHGKIESLASLFQSMVIMGSGFFLVIESVRRVMSTTQIEKTSAGSAVMSVSLVATFFLVRFLRRCAARSDSQILAVEELHFSVDLVAGLGIILALALVRWTGMTLWDIVVSLGLSLYVLYSAAGIFRKAVDELLDRSVDPVTRRKLRDTIHAHDKKIVGIHEMRTRKVGNRIFLDFHIEISGEESFKRAHFIAESLAEKIKKEYDGADVTIHYDPEGET